MQKIFYFIIFFYNIIWEIFTLKEKVKISILFYLKNKPIEIFQIAAKRNIEKDSIYVAI